MVTPTTHERKFEATEMFFSATDLKGIITEGNSVFQRISGHSFERLLGAPHNIIRHPDMPKIVFVALWGSIQAGKPICAYVKNMAANGDYYWVLATVFPVPGGYLSVRIKPSTGLLNAAQAVYPLVLAEEKKSGVDASATLLFKLLADAGFNSYESFMTAAIVSEITEHQKIMGISSDSSDSKFSAARRKAELRNEELGRMFGRLGTFSKLNKDLAASIQLIISSFSRVRTLSINMSLASRHLGKAASTLAVVSESFQVFADETNKEVAHFNDILGKSRDVLQSAEFKISCAFLQNQMMRYFIQEMESTLGSQDGDRYERNLSLLSKLTDQLVKESAQALQNAQELLSQLISSADTTEKAITSLDLVRQTGKVEAAHIPGAVESINPYLVELQKITQTLRSCLREINGGLVSTLDEIVVMRNEAEALELT